ncbi:MAG: peptidase sortase [Parcubacteria group bacterium]|nr:peptidase sortase [Parcubacteria group bacterium]
MNIPKYIGIAIILLGLTLGITTLNHAVYSAPQEAALVPETVAESNAVSAVETTTTTTSSAAIPVSPAPKPIQKPAPSVSKDPARLSIPALGIDTKVQQVGLNIKGNMGTPNNFTDVAWYKLGPRPGEIGSAVMDGHVDNGLALQGVFKHLEDLKIGDDVYVTREDGKKLHFQVVDKATYPYNDSAANETVFGKKDAARLNLVTCTGDWVAAQKTYTDRLVVFTKLVE